MPTFERSHTISLFRNPDTGKGQSVDPNSGGGWVEGEPPVISTASGAYSEGANITLTGTNFSNKNTSQLFFTNFSGGTVGQRDADFYYWNGVGTADYLINNTVTPPIGSAKVLRAHPIQQTFTEIHYPLIEDTDEIFLEAWCRINTIDFTSSPDAPQIKMFRFVDGTGETSMQGRPLNTAILLDNTGGLQVTSDPVVGNQGWFGTAPTNNTWVKYTMYMRKGTLDTNDGERFVHVGSENSFTFSGIPTGYFASPSGTVSPTEYRGEGIATNQASSSAYLFRRVAIPYFQREQQESIIDISQMYINNTKERVVIGDAATWAGCDQTKTFSAKINSRNNTEIQFTATNHSGMTGSLYAYVINRDGLFNTTGIQVK
jgi:hypothetical protein